MRAIDADKIVYSWQVDADGQEHDGVTLQSIINKMPTIEPERKTGRWIDDNCSKCGQYVYHGDVRNFCPNCGARMMEGK